MTLHWRHRKLGSDVCAVAAAAAAGSGAWRAGRAARGAAAGLGADAVGDVGLDALTLLHRVRNRHFQLLRSVRAVRVRSA